MKRGVGRVVILLAHPNFQESSANKELIEAVREVDDVSIYNLYEGGDDLFDVEEWSRTLTEANALIFQFPFHWLSAPYMLKRWEDEVLSYLANTPAIAGKSLTVVVTTGSEYEAYRSGGRNQFTVDELLRPYQATAIHAGMRWQTPLVVYGTGTKDPAKLIAQGAIQYKNIVDTLLNSSHMASVATW